MTNSNQLLAAKETDRIMAGQNHVQKEMPGLSFMILSRHDFVSR
jgi:hypothetical protein